MNSQNAQNLLDQWNSTQSAAYKIQKEHFFWNLNSQKLIQYSVESFQGTPALVGIASKTGLEFGLSATTLWLSLWGAFSKNLTLDFAQSLIDKAKIQGKKRVQIGGEEFHFVPGIPNDSETNKLITEAFQILGFESSEVGDLSGSINHEKISRYIQDSQAEAEKQGLRLIEDQSGLENFLSSEFPGRWHREYNFWQQNPKPSKSQWLSLINSFGKTIGFARISKRGLADSPSVWTPGALKLPLIPNQNPKPSDGTLGPIGVAKNQRGQGSGKVLLALTLQALRQNQTEQVCIDWTNAFKYYEPLGFERIRSYQSFWRTETE